MVKGNICEKCQKEQATTTLDFQGWRKWTVCDGCYKELQTCSKCQKNPATNLITEGKEKKQVCANCANQDPNDQGKDLCKKCQKNKATALFEERGMKEKVCAECKKLCEAWEKNNPFQLPAIRKLFDSLENLKQAKAEMEPYLQKPELIESFGKSREYGFNILFGISKEVSETSDPYCEQVKKSIGLSDKEKLGIAPDGKTLYVDFEKEEALRALEVLIKAYDWRINELAGKDIPKPNPGGKDPDKIPNKEPNKDRKPKPDELCERCGASCKKLVSTDKAKGERTWRIVRKRITHYYTNFTKKVWYFGVDCSCAEEFKKENQQTCSQCQKTEWPDMKKGWLLDYEIKKAFCKPECHVAYRKLKWEEASNLTQIEMMPPELDVSSNSNPNFNWEQEGLKREVLYWRESVKELQRQLEESKKKSPNQRHPNEIPHQERQISYLLNLHRNTQQRAESNYQSRYGTLTEDGSDKGKGMSGGIIALLIIGGIALVGGIIFFLTRNKKSKK